MRAREARKLIKDIVGRLQGTVEQDDGLYKIVASFPHGYLAERLYWRAIEHGFDAITVGSKCEVHYR